MVRRMIVAIGVLVLTACASATDQSTTSTPPTTNTTPTTTVGPSTTTPSSTVVGVVPDGFGTLAARVVAPDGEPCDVCLWSADTGELRGRGLMGVTDLGGLDGMAFVYDEPRTTRFTMRNTVMPLSIVFYSADGAHLGAFDMEPCEAEPCPSYPTPDGFTVAIEVPRGGLQALGMVPGSRLELTGACP